MNSPLPESFLPYTTMEIYSMNGPILMVFQMESGSITSYTGKVQYEFTYLDGEKHGPCRAWHFNGKLNFESQYKNNELHGEQVFWTYNGEFDHKRSYANGECIAGCMH